MIYCNTFSTFWRRTLSCLFLIGVFQPTFGAESCGQIGPDANYSKLNEILKCLEDKIDKGSSAKGTVGQSNLTEAKKSQAKTSSGKLPVVRAIGSTENSYSPVRYVRDGRTENRWMTKDGDSKGAWVELQLDYPCVIEEIAYYMVLGRAAQIRQATVKFDNDSSQQVKFDHLSESGLRNIPLTPMKAEKVKIIVDDIFDENNAKHLEIAEIELHGSQCEK